MAESTYTAMERVEAQIIEAGKTPTGAISLSVTFLADAS